MKTKIMQIIPAPRDVAAHFETDNVDRQGRTVAARVPVACLALCECTDSTGTYQDVRAMVFVPQQDSLELAGEVEGFLTITHG